MDNKNELFPIVDADGKVVGSITRGEAHSGNKTLHPVVHLHVFNSRGELFLQKRPAWKDVQPAKWDTACGGHIDYGETPAQALVREAAEELGISGFVSRFIAKYVYESANEKELVYVNATIFDGPVRPNPDELDGGRFWTAQEIAAALGTGRLTPNFESEYTRFRLALETAR